MCLLGVSSRILSVSGIYIYVEVGTTLYIYAQECIYAQEYKYSKARHIAYIYRYVYMLKNFISVIVIGTTFL